MLLFSGKSSRKNTCIGANSIDIEGRGIKCHFYHIFCPGLNLGQSSLAKPILLSYFSSYSYLSTIFNY